MISIKLARHGVTNNPFFHIVVLQSRSKPTRKPIEQLGTFNPIPDKDGNKAISLNFERAKYWISVGARPSDSVARILAKVTMGFYSATTPLLASQSFLISFCKP